MSQVKKRKVFRWLSKNRISLLFLLPATAFVSVFMIYPLCYQVFLSFFRQSSWSRTGTFVGLSNYRELLFDDSRFWPALNHNAIYTSLYVGGVAVLGLVLALLIDLRLKGWKFFRFTYYLPVMLMIPVVAVLWGRIYHPYFGLLNMFLRAIGLGSLTRIWLGEPDIVLYVVAFVYIWRACGWPMIIFLSAMSNIPKNLYDAAAIDGASTWQRVWLVTVPMIRVVISMVLILQIIWSLKVFTEIWVLTEGGPGYSSEVVSTYLFQTAFLSFRMGYASTISVVFSIFVMLITIVYLKFFGAPKTYEY